MKKSMGILGALVAILLVLVGVFFLMGGKLMEKFTGQETKVVYFFLPGCGWCQQFMPEWDKFEQLAKAEGIATEKINAQEKAEEVSKQGVTAFPTVHVVKGGKHTEYTGDRKADDLLKFAKSA